MAVEQHITPELRREVNALLSPFFKGWSGDATEPALPTVPSNRPAPAAARVLVMA